MLLQIFSNQLFSMKDLLESILNSAIGLTNDKKERDVLTFLVEDTLSFHTQVRRIFFSGLKLIMILGGRSMKKYKDMGIRLTKFYMGLTLIQIAVAAFLQIAMGADSFTVFMQGLAKTLNLSVGFGNAIITFVLLIIVYLLDKKQFKIGMVLAVISAGLILNGMTVLLDMILLPDIPIWILWIEFFLACVLVAIGFPMLKSADLGVAPNDALYLAISNRTGKPYGLVRVSVDAVYLVFGYFLGGVIGIGTVVCVIVIGPMVQFVMDHFYENKK